MLSYFYYYYYYCEFEMRFYYLSADYLLTLEDLFSGIELYGFCYARLPIITVY